jgi:hypothetical protein
MGTLSKSYVIGKHMIYLEMTTVDSANDTSDIIEALGLPFPLQGILSLLVIRASGADNTVDVAIQISNDGTNWTDALSETDVTGDASETTIATGKVARFYRIIATDVGASGDLSIYATIS